MSSLSRAVRLVVAALREIFDESAYERFLARGKMASSRQAYAAFVHERDVRRRVRCC